LNIILKKQNKTKMMDKKDKFLWTYTIEYFKFWN